MAMPSKFLHRKILKSVTNEQEANKLKKYNDGQKQPHDVAISFFKVRLSCGMVKCTKWYFLVFQLPRNDRRRDSNDRKR